MKVALNLLRRGAVLLVVVGGLTVLLLTVAFLVLDTNPEAVTDGPAITVAGTSSPLPATTVECRRAPAACPAIEVAGGSTVLLTGVDSALGLSVPGGAEPVPAVRTREGWTVEVPEAPGTMLVTSDDQVWVLRIL